MIRKTTPWVLAFVWTAVAACSVVSYPVKSISLTGVSFPALLTDAGRYRGQTVVLGGYLLGTENRPTTTQLTVLQTPLGLYDEPGSRDGSQGRFQVTWDGFLDPELYSQGRRITVAGKVLGTAMGAAGDTRIAYLQLEGLEIHLWPLYEPVYVDPYYPYYWDLWFEPFFWYAPFYYHGPHGSHRPYRPHPPHRPHAPHRPPPGRPF